MEKRILILLVLFALVACNDKSSNEGIEDDELGFINADVTSEDTEFKFRAEYAPERPGESAKINRAFENAPPLIPHTTSGFFPVKYDRNICLSCHMPEKAKEVEAVALPETHMANIRPQLDKLNNAYFNCSQCHSPVTNVKIDITNLFTPEFREEFGISTSDLIKRIVEGI